MQLSNELDIITVTWPVFPWQANYSVNNEGQQMQLSNELDIITVTWPVFPWQANYSVN